MDVYEKEKQINRAIDEGQEKMKHAAHEAQGKFRQGQERLANMMDQADEQLHENPWPILAGVALSCLCVGFLAGKSR